MAENKKGFMLYSDQKELFNQLSNEQAGLLIKHIFSYVNDENPISDDLIINIAFTPIKQQLKRDLIKWEERAERSRLNGSKGGRKPNLEKPKEPSGLKLNPNEPKEPDNVNVNDNDNVNVIKEREQNKILQLEKKKLEFKQDIININKNINYNKLELKKFYEYWTEHNKNGYKMRFEKEKVFDIKRRLGTWFAKTDIKEEIPQKVKYLN